MIHLLSSILFTASLGVWFKLFQRRRIPLVVVIPVNYFVCAVLGVLFTGSFSAYADLFAIKAGEFCLLQSVLLVINFFLLALTSQRVSIAAGALASRMSVVVPTAASFFLFGDPWGFSKAAGIMLAVIALYLMLRPESAEPATPAAKNSAAGAAAAVLPMATFATYGLYFLLLKYVQHRHLAPGLYHHYTGACFCFGFVFSLAPALRSRIPVKPAYLAYGALLGLCNYGSVYFILKALGTPGMHSSLVFPAFAVGTVIGSVAAAWMLFEESLSARRMAGIAAGIAAIILLNV